MLCVPALKVDWSCICFSKHVDNSLISATKAGNMAIMKLLLDKDIKFLEKKNKKKVGYDNSLSMEFKNWFVVKDFSVQTILIYLL